VDGAGRAEIGGQVAGEPRLPFGSRPLCERATLSAKPHDFKHRPSLDPADHHCRLPTNLACCANIRLAKAMHIHDNTFALMKIRK
jgi:hypothetical protein